MSDSGAPSFVLRFFAGIAFGAAGLFPILAAFDVGPFRADSINGPPWLGVAVGAIFLTGAAFLFFHGAATRLPWLGALFAFAIVAGFSALTNWIAFGPGPRECSSSFSLAVFTGSLSAAGLECRIAFGLGGMMCNGLLVTIAGRGLQQAGVESALPGYLDKIGTGLIVLGFAPFLLIFVVFKLVEQGARWCWSRVTGRATEP